MNWNSLVFSSICDHSTSTTPSTNSNTTTMTSQESKLLETLLNNLSHPRLATHKKKKYYENDKKELRMLLPRYN